MKILHGITQLVSAPLRQPIAKMYQSMNPSSNLLALVLHVTYSSRSSSMSNRISGVISTARGAFGGWRSASKQLKLADACQVDPAGASPPKGRVLFLITCLSPPMRPPLPGGPVTSPFPSKGWPYIEHHRPSCYLRRPCARLHIPPESC